MRVTFLGLAAALQIAWAGVAGAQEPVSDGVLFMERFSGEWRGTGQVLLGQDSGLKFHCSLDGNPSRTGMTFGMTGRCWMGKMAAPVFAKLRFNPETNRFYGEFMDGADGNGVDVVGQREGEGFELKLVRGSAQGRLVAEPVGTDEMRVLISLYDRRNNRDIPIVAMGFAKAETLGLSPEITGTIERHGVNKN
jgi:hypothetical protein